MAEQTRAARTKKEVSRLNKIFKNIPEEKKAVVAGLIHQAARLRIILDDMWEDISLNGDVEKFSQSEKTEPYERERPVARLFNARDKNYQTTIKLLLDLLPETESTSPAEELMEFIARGKS